MSLSLEQVGAVLLALVILFVAGHPLVCTGGDGEGCYCPPLFFRKTEPWHPLPPDEGDSGDGPPSTV